MNGPATRARARTTIESLLKRRLRVLGDETLPRPAVVIAPHPDDETLGCGGTIVRKTTVGAHVRIVVMTDGRGSHRNLMEEARLGSIRAREAIEAAGRMGVERDRVHMLGYRDKELGAHVDEAADRVRALLDEEPAEEIYIPFLHEPPPDHVAARRAALAAASRSGAAVTVFEYPVWFWYHWPWVPCPLSSRRRLPAVVLQNFRAAIRLVGGFNAAVRVADVLDRKRHALDAYASQMTRLTGDPAWSRLQDVAEGEFLQCFFREHEVFWEHHLAARNT